MSYVIIPKNFFLCLYKVRKMIKFHSILQSHINMSVLLFFSTGTSYFHFHWRCLSFFKSWKKKRKKMKKKKRICSFSSVQAAQCGWFSLIHSKKALNFIHWWNTELPSFSVHESFLTWLAFCKFHLKISLTGGSPSAGGLVYTLTLPSGIQGHLSGQPRSRSGAGVSVLEGK